jgi:hypothetical protein
MRRLLLLKREECYFSSARTVLLKGEECTPQVQGILLECEESLPV